MNSDIEQGQLFSILVDSDPSRGKSPFCERGRMVLWADKQKTLVLWE